MTNKEFQNLLSQYPDDYNISVNWAFGWEVPSNKYKEDPYIYVNDDCGFIEIEPKEYRDIWIKCSERLPMSGTDYLPFVDKWGNRWFGRFKNGSWYTIYGYGNCEIRVDYDDVVAWMEIPKFEEE